MEESEITARRTIDAPHGQELVDVQKLHDWLSANGLPGEPITSVTPLTGGSQNVLLRFERAGAQYVLRRPPAHPTRNGSDTMRREARVLKALTDSNVPHARLVAACDDETVLGAAFYVMEAVNGFNAALGLPSLHAGNRTIRRHMGFEMADVLARISRIDYVGKGLADLGRPEGFLERQVARWRSQLDSYSQYAGWPGAVGVPHLEQVETWLHDNLPTGSAPGLMHGDYHFKNVMFSDAGPKIVAVVDWELTTVGDPLVDLGWLVATWRTPDGDPNSTTIVVEPWDGFPSASELVAYYGNATGRDVSNIAWYAVFACYKLGIILEGTHARAFAGRAPAVIGERLHGNTLLLFRKAKMWSVDGV